MVLVTTLFEEQPLSVKYLHIQVYIHIYKYPRMVECHVALRLKRVILEIEGELLGALDCVGTVER